MNAANILPWIVLLTPLAAAIGITLFTRRDGRLSAQLSIIAVIISFVASVILFGLFSGADRVPTNPVEWLHAGALSIQQIAARMVGGVPARRLRGGLVRTYVVALSS